MTTPSERRRFDIALSFPGDHRAIVEEIANNLATTFSEDRVLYDKYHDAELARPDLDVYLPNLYRTESELLVIFLCAEYPTKRWCRLEWRYIKQLISTVNAGRIMFLSIGDPGDLSQIGILSGDGYINIDSLSPQKVADKIRKRLNINEGESPPEIPKTIPTDIDRIIKYAPTELIGRETETALLNDAWEKVQKQESKRPHVITFFALGGEGKTSLVAKWAADLASQNWPGCDAVFAWSFYSQGTREQVAVSSDLFLAEALKFFGDAEMAGSAQGAYDKGKRLAQLVAQQKALLILDGLEPLQYAPSSPLAGELKDQGVSALLKSLAANSQGLCVVTTRYKIPDLRAYWQNNAPMHDLPRLARAAGVKLLQTIGVKGSLFQNIPSDDGREKLNEFEKLVEDVAGHALTLQIIGQFLVRAFHGDIRRRDRVNFEKADAKIQGGHAFRAMESYAKWMEDDSDESRREVAILKLLGLFDRPATADCIAVLRQPPVIPGLTEPLVDLAEEDWGFSISSLKAAKLITAQGESSENYFSSFQPYHSIDAHPLIRLYFAARVRSPAFMWNLLGNNDIPPEGEVTSQPWREANRRLYEHLCAATEGDEPSLEDLQPLYQAVAHGCRAGLQQETFDKVYIARIRKHNEYYSVIKLDAFGSDLAAIVPFFKSPWSKIADSIVDVPTRSAILSTAAYCLRATGRLADALEPLNAALKIQQENARWKEAAGTASQLSQIHLQYNSITKAIKFGMKAVEFADQCDEQAERIKRRCLLAWARHEAGKLDMAGELFAVAERMQSEMAGNNSDQPEELNSWAGFLYSEYLLDCRESEVVKVRARRELDRAKKTLGGLDDAFCHLSLARALIREAMVEVGDESLLEAKKHMDNSIAHFRSYGNVDDFPRALLTRAWLRHLTGACTGHDSAREDLDEAWEIASRGGMRLFMTDIHLYRARLFGVRNSDLGLRNEEKYPWESPEADLAAAEKLINECGYHRRDEELADAKRMILTP